MRGSKSSYLTQCVECGGTTSKLYSRQHEGKCKQCVSGTSGLYVCPDCGERRLTSYQRKHHYHCDQCTRETDPVGYYREVMGFND